MNNIKKVSGKKEVIRAINRKDKELWKNNIP
jgi:hypothetical protein